MAAVAENQGFDSGACSLGITLNERWPLRPFVWRGYERPAARRGNQERAAGRTNFIKSCDKSFMNRNWIYNNRENALVRLTCKKSFLKVYLETQINHLHGFHILNVFYSFLVKISRV